ncbi:hypothetical protein TTHERM_00483660 (macronuclear) [Tetrahymena thermophila SB210]|uniref:Uncharacterized protein n=1 Tax=Tetrahymena thermophila (strain SB210) TaxID=312017 RepID=I7M1N4_TETTS|nr:hypothetical protein TTHERM_00483660 [Tetrahymena thermophila SB210]EAR97234.2 hypothetical protein TTHERM_00483660 [Tetrahymena thermophila SB210]|eukprot:XP_001017479.2 hypothetical protein TTHERM_00483660 [Tetrahymena thermophila SB210]
MGKKEKSEPKDKKEVQKEQQYTNYLYPKVEIPPENQGWMHIKFILIENNWHFADFELDMKAKDPIFCVLSKIENRHGKICNVKLYKDLEKKEEINFTDTLGEAYKTQGEIKKQDAKSFNLYYVFDVNIKSPLLLYEMN